MMNLSGTQSSSSMSTLYVPLPTACCSSAESSGLFPRLSLNLEKCVPSASSSSSLSSTLQSWSKLPSTGSNFRPRSGSPKQRSGSQKSSQVKPNRQTRRISKRAKERSTTTSVTMKSLARSLSLQQKSRLTLWHTISPSRTSMKIS